jgi:hypothetical protein
VALYFLDTTLIDAHSEKQHAARTFKRGFGLDPMWAFIDHGHPLRHFSSASKFTS